VGKTPGKDVKITRFDQEAHRKEKTLIHYHIRLNALYIFIYLYGPPATRFTIMVYIMLMIRIHDRIHNIFAILFFHLD